MIRTLVLLTAAACAFACGPAGAEGFFRASLEVVDDTAWPEMRLLVRVIDESGDPTRDYTALPNVHSTIDCPRGLCWSVTLAEDGLPVEVLAQASTPLAPREHVQFLWLRYRSPREHRADVELDLHLATSLGAASNRTAANQSPLYPLDAADFPHMANGPWIYLARYYDHHLNAAYEALMQRLPESHRAALRHAQRAWIDYRDAACTGLEDGPVRDARSHCLASRSRERTTALEAIRIRLMHQAAG